MLTDTFPQSYSLNTTLLKFKLVSLFLSTDEQPACPKVKSPARPRKFPTHSIGWQKERDTNPGIVETTKRQV